MSDRVTAKGPFSSLNERKCCPIGSTSVEKNGSRDLQGYSLTNPVFPRGVLMLWLAARGGESLRLGTISWSQRQRRAFQVACGVSLAVHRDKDFGA